MCGGPPLYSDTSQSDATHAYRARHTERSIGSKTPGPSPYGRTYLTTRGILEEPDMRDPDYLRGESDAARHHRKASLPEHTSLGQFPLVNQLLAQIHEESA